MRGRRAGADEGGDLGAVAAAELVQDVGHVSVDRALGDEQPFSDLPVGKARGDQLGDFRLAAGERRFLLRMRTCRFRV